MGRPGFLGFSMPHKTPTIFFGFSLKSLIVLEGKPFSKLTQRSRR